MCLWPVLYTKLIATTFRLHDNSIYYMSILADMKIYISSLFEYTRFFRLLNDAHKCKAGEDIPFVHDQTLKLMSGSSCEMKLILKKSL